MLENKPEFAIDEQEDEDLRCPICNYYFSSFTKPYLLPCNHNLCIKCIDSIIDKKMYNCPICRKSFSSEDRINFQVNFAFLNLVVKILKTKVIFCKKCSKVYNWIDHHSICDQNNFKEANEIYEELKKLGLDCVMIIRYIERHKNILNKSKISIYESTSDIMKVINLKFYENFHRTIDSFFQNVPEVNFEMFTREMKTYINLCKPLDSSFNNLNLQVESNYMDDTNIGYKTIKIDKSPLLNIGAYSSNHVTDQRTRMKSASHYLTDRRKHSGLSTEKLKQNINNIKEIKFQINEDEGEQKNTSEDETVILEQVQNDNIIKKYLTGINSIEQDSKVLSENDSRYQYNYISDDEDQTKMGKVNTPKNLGANVNTNNNLFFRNSIEINRGSSGDLQLQLQTHNEPSVLNFNLSDLIDTEDNNISNMTSTESSITHVNQKIIVRNNKIEIMSPSRKKLNDNVKIKTELPASVLKKEKFISPKKCVNLPAQENKHSAINKILLVYNKTKDVVQRVLNFTQQVEFTSESIRSQISTNYNYLNESISRNLNSLCDNIALEFKFTHKRFLINLIENSKKIWLFDVRKMKCEIKEFPNLNQKLTVASGIEFDDGDLIFITGGKNTTSIFDSDSNYSNSFIILRWSNKLIELAGQIPRKRAYHSSIYFDNKLYVIGGISNSATQNIKDCECYNIIDKRWELMPSMTTSRSNPSLCIYNGSYLYAFRGWSLNSNGDYSYLDTIEFLNVRNINVGWTLFTPEDPGLCWSGLTNSVATVIGLNKILICGGSYNKECSKLVNHTFIFDPLKKSIFRSKDLCKFAAFNTNGTVYENNLIIIDFKNDCGKPFGVHVYDIDNKLWKFNQ